VELETHVPKVGKTISHWLLEGVFIVFSVLLGFAVGQYREYRADRELARRALSSIQSELEHNLAIVEPYVPFHRAFVDKLDGVDVTAMHESGFMIFFKVRPPIPKGADTDVPLARRAAWDAASSSGALRLLDYDVVAGLSEIYGMQDHLRDAINRIPMSNPTFFDVASAQASIQLARIAVREMVFAEETLVTQYRKELTLLRTARGE